MTSFRFSPITDKTQLVTALTYIHSACHRLCLKTLGIYLPVAGNIGIFSHYDNEYVLLTRLQQEMTDPSLAVYGKYFRLHAPIQIPSNGVVPAATYTHLYIRKPDPEKPQVGDLDFFMEQERHAELKQSLIKGKILKGIRILPNRPDLDLIELNDSDTDALGYIGTKIFQ